MSEIIGFIISYVIAYLLALAISLLVAWLMLRKTEKHISNKMSTFRESRAARSESADEIHEDISEIDKSLDSISESLDRMNESMDRTIEFKRLISEYLDNKIKRIEARENFCESQFWDEKNIH